MTYQIWYMKPDWFREGVSYAKPDPSNLDATHVHLKDVEIVDQSHPLEHIFTMMQGEVWSPNGEARPLIAAKGLGHTSMSVGDVVVDPEGRVQLVASAGFEDLGLRPEAAIERSDNRNRPIAGDVTCGKPTTFAVRSGGQFTRSPIAMARTTREQRRALKAKWLRLVDDFAEAFKRGGRPTPPPTYRQFRASVQPTLGCDGAVAVRWCGLWLCIERDGYAHS